MQVVIDYLVSCISSKEEEVRDIAALGESKLLGPVPTRLHRTVLIGPSSSVTGLKTVIAEMPSHSNLARSATGTLAPKLLSEINSVSTIASHRAPAINAVLTPPVPVSSPLRHKSFSLTPWMS
jgi:hypothetical protein